MIYFIHLNELRKSVWKIINDGIVTGATLSIISLGCCLDPNGYAGLYLPDVQLWAVIHAITDVNPVKLYTRRASTSKPINLKKMVKDAICSDNYFAITLSELANSQYRLPRLAHYDSGPEMSDIVDWLRNTIGMTSFMVHAHFRPFLQQAFENTARE